MLAYIEYLNLPTKVAIILVGVFLGLQLLGEFLEFKGKIVPEFIKMRKYFARKKRERAALAQITVVIDEYQDMKTTLADVQRLLLDIDEHYSKDNISKRDSWMKEVNEHIVESEQRKKEQDDLMRELSAKIDKNNADTLSLLLDSKRNMIIDFASKVSEESYPVTKEQFNRIFRIYEEYERLIEENNMTNGEVDIAHRMIIESYENHMKNHSFIEDKRGY